MIEALADILNLIVQPCYALTGNWWASIFLFTVIAKVILMPMALWCQKNSIVMVQLMPDLNRIKLKYFGDRDTIGEKQNELYKEKHYHALLSLIPLGVQILILFGLVDVIHRITDGGAPGTEFMGLVPATDGGLSWIMPFLAALSAVIMGCAQNVINPLQREQSTMEKNTTNGLSIALSLFLGIFVSAGMAFYWICSNLISIAVQALCNVIIDPHKYIDYDDLRSSAADLAALDDLESQRKTKWYQRDPLAKREKADYKRFFKTADKHIVFYSEASGFYKYFKGAIDWVLANSDAPVHYVTNDPNDQIFGIAEAEPRIKPYFVGEKKCITLMMKMDADMVVTTLEDLEKYYIKRSYVRDDIEYVFMFHHMMSTHLTPQKGAYDAYDTLLCVGPHQVEEIRAAEKLYDVKPKRLIECGYDLLDQEIAAYQNMTPNDGDTKTVLIAPSWQEDNILDSCFSEVVDSLLELDCRIVVRPHPEYTKRFTSRWEALQAKYAEVGEDRLYFERDFSSNESIFTSDLMITDWSSVACEFSFSTLKPTIFINTPMKVGNPHYLEIGIEPTDISLRDAIGTSIDLDKLDGLKQTANQMLTNPEEWNARIEQVRTDTIFNLGHGAEMAGEYLVDEMLELQRKRTEPVEGEVA